MAIRILDMFCGMSAFRTAAEQLGGFSFVGYCDNDPTAVAAYRTLWLHRPKRIGEHQPQCGMG